MKKIKIISASVRTGRASHRVALFFQNFLNAKNMEVEILDLAQINFPLFHERLAYQENPTKEILDFAKAIKEADGVLIVTPEYNGGYPASLKNVIDLLYAEWYKKPIAITTVSDGVFGGSQVITSLLFTLWKIRAWVVPAMFPVPKVHTTFDETGNANDPAVIKRAENFVNEFVWCMEAKAKMESSII